MGSQGLTPQDGIFAGSNAEKMVRYSSTPVLIMKSNPRNFNLNNVVLATDMSLESTDTFKETFNFLTGLGSNVNVVYVNRPNKGFISTKEFNHKVQEFDMADGTDKIEFIAGHTIEDGLIRYADKTNADVIVVIANARKGLNHFLKGSISEDLANRSKLPVMTFKL